MAKPATPTRKPAARTRKTSAKVTPASQARSNKGFPIVGIGASAGGLEAIEQFLRAVPQGSGIAFVIVQHLDPVHKGMLPELLQRTTTMQVRQAASRMKVAPDHVYVIPPNKDLSIRQGMLQLHKASEPRGMRLPIDFFFRTLAEDQRANAFGVVLSGMGSDGTLGLRAIKENAGLALVQKPASAQFDSMPRSAISAGLADIVANPAELPKRIIDFVRQVSPEQTELLLQGEAQEKALEKILDLLQARTSHDFSLYKKSTIYRRIERRMGLHQLHKAADYARYLGNNPQEIDLLFKELLIGVTSFFRDPPAWEFLQKQALPQLLASFPKGKTIRAWAPGCSTGEEAYSLAIAFLEVVEHIKPKARFTLQVFATDLDSDAVEKARRGFYPANIAADVSAERLTRFFVEEEGGYSVGKEIREMVVFAQQNVIMDPPFTKLDLLTCRNLLIYLGSELQRKLLPLFHYCLNPGGILFLGSAETIGGFANLFVPLDAQARLYRRTDYTAQPMEVEFPGRTQLAQSAGAEKGKSAPAAVNLQTMADQLLLQEFAPPAVLVNADGNILYISGRTGKFLEPAAGKANWNVYAMARNGLRQELVLALPKALRDAKPVTLSGVQIGSLSVDVTVRPIDQPEVHGKMAMIAFTGVTESKPARRTSSKRVVARGRPAELEQELASARAEIQTVREEMQSQQEELKSSNEELQSTNEELQSTNEELTTSKEELQSLNEELQTVNVELKARVDELSSSNNDMKNLLNSTDIATVFLDNALHVRRYTTQATKIFKLIPSDVGRPLSDIVSSLKYAGLKSDAEEVLRTLAFSEKQVAAGDGRWFNVKIMPYRTQENVIGGVVITFSDITAAKKLETELRETLTKSREDRS